MKKKGRRRKRNVVSINYNHTKLKQATTTINQIQQQMHIIIIELENLTDQNCFKTHRKIKKQTN